MIITFGRIHRIIFYFICVTVFVKVSGQGQVGDPNASKIEPTPPSPQAADLGKYGEVPVGHQTGIPNISIPLGSITLNDFTLPISLTYYSMGNKVDEVASNVGLGWTLQATGSISTSTRGNVNELPDDSWTIPTPPPAQSGYGSGNAACDYINVNVPLEYQQAKMYLEEHYNFENSVYNFKFAGHSGQFFFRSSVIDSIGEVEEAAIIPAQNLRIIRGLDPTALYVAIDDNGVMYYFDDYETSSMTSACIPGSLSPQYPSGNESFFLSKIITPNGHVIQFTYASESYDYIHSRSQSFFGVPFPNNNNCEAGIQPTLTECTNTMFVGALKLVKIESSDGQVVEFKHSPRSDLNGASKLDSIKVLNNGNVIKRFALFTSYFGGAPSGNLELNELGLKLRLDSLKEFSNEGSLPPYAFTYNSSVSQRVYGGKDFFGYSNGSGNSYFPTSIIPNQPDIAYMGAIREPNLAALEGILERITYPTSGRTEFEYELEYIGGVRIKRIRNYSHASNLAVTKRFYYGPGGPNPVTGLYDYGTFFSQFRSMTDTYYPFANDDLSQCALEDNCYFWLISSENQNVDVFDYPRKYFFIEEIIEDPLGVPNSKLSYNYNGFTTSYSPSSILYNINVVGIPGLYLTDQRFLQDQLATVTEWKSIDPNLNTWTRVRQVLYNYEVPGTSEFTLRNVRIEQVYSEQFYQDNESMCIYCRPALFNIRRYQYFSTWVRPVQTVETYFDNNDLPTLITTTNYLDYDSISKKPTHVQTVQSDGKISEVFSKYPSAFGGIAVYQNMVNKNIVSSPVVERTATGGVLVHETVNKFASINGLFKPTAINVFDGGQNVLISEFPLPTDPDNLGPSYFEAAKDMTYNAKGNLLSYSSSKGIHVKFKWGYQDQHFIAKKEGSDSLDFYYNGFEENGSSPAGGIKARTGDFIHLIQGINFSIPFQPAQPSLYLMSYWYYSNNVWAFSGDVPFASSISTSALYLDDVMVYPKGSYVTSYTYKYGRGVTSVTDPNNITSYYEYDSFGRLMFIKDDKGSILKSYSYHFKN